MEDTNKPRKCINVVVSPTTGGKFQIEVFNDDTIDELRRKIARHLQMPGEKLKVIFRQRVLSHGTVSDHEIRDGNELRLLPAIESGFSSTVQGTQQSIINAIESLSDDQIDDFLSGRSPLTLALRVGDHMMFVQLQLEQASAGVASSSASSAQIKHKSFKDHHGRASSSSREMVGPSSASSSSSASILDTVYSSMKQQQHKMFKCHHNSLPHAAGSSKATSANLPSSSSSPPPILLPNQPNLQRLLNANRMSYGTSSAVRSSQQHPSASGVRRATSTATIPTSYTATDNNNNKTIVTTTNKASAFSDLKWNDSSALLAKPEQRHSNHHHHHHQQQQRKMKSSSSSKQVRQQADGSGGISSSASLRRSATTTSGRITSGVGSLSQSCSGSKIIRQMQRLKRLCSSHQQCVAYSNRELASEISSIVHAAKHSYPDSVQTSSTRSNKKVRLASASAQLHHQQSVSNNNIAGNQQQCAKTNKNTAGASSSGNSAPATSITGASIDSFITHGPGIFSGTFSGALHPNIQDQQGRPKRDPQTILQILTDLLSATSKYQGSGSGSNELGVIPQVIRDQLIKQNAAATSSASSKTRQLLSAQLQDAAIRVESRPKTIKQEHHNQQQQSANNKLRRSASNLYHQPHHPFNCLTAATPQSMVNLHPAYQQVKFSRCHHHHHGNTKMVQNFNNQQRRIKQQQIHQQANLNMITRRKQDENQLTRCKMQHVTAMIRMKRYLRLQRKRNQEMEGQGQEWSEPATTSATASEVERTASPTQEIVSPMEDDLQQQQQQTDENEDNNNNKQKSDCHESLTV